MIDPEVYARAKMPAGPRGEYQPSTTPYRRDQNMNVGIPEIREALRSGSMTRDELAAHFRTGRAVVAKPVYSLIQSGEAIEEGGRISLLRRDLPSKPSEAQESHPSTTQGDQIDSRAVSEAGMGMSGAGCLASLNDLDNACPTQAQLHEHHGCSGSETRPHDDFPDPDFTILNMSRDRQAKKLRDALSLLMAELPALLEDREKLRKLREVLG
ncbi:MAG: hypothetical protein M0T84_01535 [Betaproteobacteria bacterium]|nr:hypothetical protein [Betaproteobacteria bacterium]